MRGSIGRVSLKHNPNGYCVKQNLYTSEHRPGMHHAPGKAAEIVPFPSCARANTITKSPPCLSQKEEPSQKQSSRACTDTLRGRSRLQGPHVPRKLREAFLKTRASAFFTLKRMEEEGHRKILREGYMPAVTRNLLARAPQNQPPSPSKIDHFADYARTVSA